MLYETIIGGAAVTLAGPFYRRFVTERRAWAALGQAFGFDVDFGGLSPSDVLRGDFEGYKVQVVCAISQTARWRGEWSMRYVLDSDGRVPEALTFEPSGAIRPSRGGRRSGDFAFDGRVLCAGPRLMLGTVLDHDTRAQLLELVGRRNGVVRKGLLELEQRGRATSEAQIRETLALLAAFARHLELAASRGLTALLETARFDPYAGVRCRAMELLAGYYANHESAKAVLRDALHDRAMEVRFCAAMNLKQEGLETLLELVDKGGLLPQYRVRALVRLAAKGRGAKVEDALLEMLSANLDPAVMSAAVDALARVGSLRAVERLLPLTTFWSSTALRRRARTAIRRIQDRTAGGEIGALSFSEEEDMQGALTLEDRAGRVSTWGKAS